MFIASASQRFFLNALICTTLFSLPTTIRAGDTWPQFRGPNGQGLSDEVNVPLQWGGPEKKNILWSAPLPGQGHASPIVWKDRVFTCTVTWPDSPDLRRAIPDHHVTCFNAADGAQLWNTKLPPGQWVRNDFRSGPGGGYAAPTPCTDGKNLFVAFGSAVLASLDFQGNIAWRIDLVPHTFDVTLGSSPILYNDTVILLFAMANKKDSRLVAFHKSDGKVKWETRLPTTGFAHSTPLLIDVNGQPQLLILASGMATTDDALQSFNPATGEKLWHCRGAGDASSPAYGNGLVFFDSGRGSPLWAVDPTGAGDLSNNIKWTTPKLPEAVSSPLVVGDHLYRLTSPNLLKCFNAKTGEQLYSQKLDGLTSSWSSPIATKDGHILIASGGRSFTLKSGPAFHLLHTNDLNDPNHASPAVSNGRLYILGLNKLHCIGAK